MKAWAGQHWLWILAGAALVCAAAALTNRGEESTPRRTGLKARLAAKLAPLGGWKDDAGLNCLDPWPRHPDRPGAPLGVRYKVTPTEPRIAQMGALIAGHLGGEWSWEIDHIHDRVRFTRQPPPPELPERYDYQHTPADPIDSIPFAAGDDGKPIVAHLNGTGGPHVLVSAPTGAGKTTIITVFAAHIANRGGVIDICDPKRIGFIKTFAGLPNVRLSTSIEQMIGAVSDFLDDLLERYRLIEDGVDVSDRAVYPMRLLVVDEAGSFAAMANQVWAQEGNKGQHPILNDLLMTLWQGRSAGFHVMTAAQQANAKALGGTSDARDQYALRIAAGTQSTEAWKMMFGTEPKPSGGSGKGHAVVGIGYDLRVARLAILEPGRARELAAAGTGRHPRPRPPRPPRAVGEQCEQAGALGAVHTWTAENAGLELENADSSVNSVNAAPGSEVGNSAHAEPQPLPPVTLTCSACSERWESRSATVARCPGCGKRQRIPASLRRSASL